MNKRLKKCPVCNSNLSIVEYSCKSCGTHIKGSFTISKFAALNSRQQEFVKAFICCSGSIKEVEKVLNISYPTVKNRLAAIQQILCDEKNVNSHSQTEDILDKIENGKISVENALKKLKEGR